MAEVLLKLTSDLWVKDICQFLTASEVLVLRTLNKHSQAFVTALLSDLGAAKSANAERLLALEGAQRGAARVQELEPLREAIAGIDIEATDFASILSFSSPPGAVRKSLQLILGLRSGRENVSWKIISREIRLSSFVPDLVAYFRALVPRAFPPALITLAESMEAKAFASTSSACVELWKMGQAVVKLQSGYAHAEAREWLRANKLKEEASKECKIYEKVVQGMPKSVREQRKAEKEKKTSGKRQVIAVIAGHS